MNAPSPTPQPARQAPAALPPPPPVPPKPAEPPQPLRLERRRLFPWLRPTIRIRLTITYGGMFLAAGIVLVAVVYLLAAQGLRDGTQLPFRLIRGEYSGDVCDYGTSVVIDADQFQRCVDARMAAQRDQALNDLFQKSLLVLVVLTVLAFALGYMMAGRVLRPLGRITQTARSVAGSALNRRIKMEGPDDELKELADTFDDMLDRLDRAFDSQRRFVANASHELRTPLAINRTLLEVQLADSAASPDVQQLGKTLLATNERSEQLVEGLLLLARSENALTMRKPVDLAEAVTQALEQTRPEAQAKGVELGSDLQAAVVPGNGVLLERIALNLVQNAVRYNVPDGWVKATTATRGGSAVLVVSNTGPIVPGYELDNIFEPFRRLRTERTSSDKGVGLGLSIVRSVVRAHGGAITAVPRPEGGLEMTVRIPIA